MPCSLREVSLLTAIAFIFESEIYKSDSCLFANTLKDKLNFAPILRSVLPNIYLLLFICFSEVADHCV